MRGRGCSQQHLPVIPTHARKLQVTVLMLTLISALKKKRRDDDSLQQLIFTFKLIFGGGRGEKGKHRRMTVAWGPGHLGLLTRAPGDIALNPVTSKQDRQQLRHIKKTKKKKKKEKQNTIMVHS